MRGVYEYVCIFFCFKQKTAYEMRISDWSSDVCSSDLRIRRDKNPRFYDADAVALKHVVFYPTEDDQTALKRFRAGELDSNDQFPARQYAWLKANKIGRASCRERVCQSV